LAGFYAEDMLPRVLSNIHHQGFVSSADIFNDFKSKSVELLFFDMFFDDRLKDFGIKTLSLSDPGSVLGGHVQLFNSKYMRATEEAVAPAR
jgi:hypothetical protein